MTLSVIQIPIPIPDDSNICMYYRLLDLILTSAASRVTGVTTEEAPDLPVSSEDQRSRQEPFPRNKIKTWL